MATQSQDGRNIHQGKHVKVFSGVPRLDLDLELDLGGHKINLDEHVEPSILSVPELNVEQQQWVEDLKRKGWGGFQNKMIEVKFENYLFEVVGCE